MKFNFFKNKKQNKEITNQDNKPILVKEQKQEIFTIDTFLNDIRDINSISALDLVKRIFFLSEEEKEIVLSNDIVRNKLRKGLLEESLKNQYEYYDEVLMYLSSVDFLSLYDGNYLKTFFENKSNGEEYKLFVCLIANDLNEIIRYILKDEIMFEEFFRKNDYFYSMFKGLDYILLRKIIFMMEKHDLRYKFDFICSIPPDDQISLLNENIKDATILKLLPLLSTDSIDYFFKNNVRAKYLLSRTDIQRLIEDGTQFSDEILKSKIFFNALKSHSFIQFRTNINHVEKYNNPVFIEENLKKYYEEMILNYNKESKMFREYDEILEKIKYIKIEYGKNFILSGDFIFKINKILRENPKPDINKITSILLKETSKKLSEIIVDALFRDNIYNVFLNINEMIRYNELLGTEQKVLTKEKLEFYKLILSFDSINNDKKIEIYNNLKDKNYNLTFYEDLRKLKDLSYKEIKEELSNPIAYYDCLDKENSNKYEIDIYDLRNKEYNLLVRKQWTYQEISQYEANCYSLISNENNQVFNMDETVGYIYGYNNFEIDKIVHVLETDAFSASCKENCSIYVNRIMTLRQIINSNNGYSEIQIINKKIEEDNYKYKVLKPNYLVVFENITDRVIRESKRLNIPIVIINRQKLQKENEVNIDLNKDLDIYVDNTYYEDKKKLIREYNLHEYLQNIKFNI